jgi:hypothetical protein
MHRCVHPSRLLVVPSAAVAVRTFRFPWTRRQDPFEEMEALMDERFSRMNADFDRAMKAFSKANGAKDASHYSKSVVRSFNGEGNCGEETVVERDAESGKEVTTHIRRLGDRAMQTISTKDLKSGTTATDATVTRKNMDAGEDAAFEKEWAEAEKKFIAPTRGSVAAPKLAK